MTTVHKIIGPPGTGKTTKLLSILEKELETVDPSHIAYVSFTRAAVYEARGRATGLVGCGSSGGASYEWFRTLHSLCFRALGLTRDQTVTPRRLEEFGKTVGLNIIVRGRADEAPDFGRKTIGNSIYAEYQRSRTSGQWFDPTRLVPEATEHHWRYFMEQYAEWKFRNNMVDFQDFLDRFLIERPEVDVEAVIIDEAQDLSETQWQVVEAFASNAERLYIAGDPNQAIYGFAGADPDGFNSHFPDANVEVLPKSYRMPSQIHAFSKKVEARIGTDHQFEPSEIGGGVYHYGPAFDMPELEMYEGSWLMLYRNRYQQGVIEMLLRTRGFRYSVNGSNDRFAKEAQAIINWMRPITLPGKALKAMVPYLDDAPKRFADNLTETSEDTYDLDTRGVPWYNALTKLMNMDYLLMLSANGALLEPSRITLSTIHAAKGGEADHVAVWPDQSPACLNNVDSEDRVFYVAATRAKKTLHIMHPQTEIYYAY